jgi:MoaA/NifB/PqqE/SkfB family radical SAM enzyme
MGTLSQKMKLLKGLMTGQFAYTGPFHITVDVTRRCNLQCVGCRFHSPGANRPSPSDPAVLDIHFDFFEKLCNDLRTIGTRTLFLMGEGEPFLHRHIFEIISTAKTSGFHVTLITNGVLLNRARIQSLFESRLDVLQISLWASSLEEYEQQYPGTDPSNSGKVVDGMKLQS